MQEGLKVEFIKSDYKGAQGRVIGTEQRGETEYMMVRVEVSASGSRRRYPVELLVHPVSIKTIKDYRPAPEPTTLGDSE